MSGFAVTTLQPPAVGILSARMDSIKTSQVNSNANITLGVNSDRYQTFLVPAQNIDTLGLTTTASVNFKKGEISDLGDSDEFFSNPDSFNTGVAATNAIATIYGDVISTVGFHTFLTFGASQTFTVGNKIAQDNTGAFGDIVISNTGTGVLLTGVGGTDPFNTTDICSVGIGTTFKATDTQIGAPTLSALAGFGDIYQDVSLIYTYPNLEPVDTSQQNPYGNATSVVLGAGNTGLGIGNTFYQNALDGGNVLGGATFIGTVFTFDTTGNPGAATSITNIEGEIDNLRLGIVSFTQTNDIIKPYKIDFAINVWSLSKVNAENQVTMAGLATAIAVLNNPEFGGPY